jgi:hypothetical protein
MILFAAIALASASTIARAQTMRVRLLDEVTHQPVVGALVSALNSAGASGLAVLSSVDGIANVLVGNADPARLLIRRIGFEPVTTEPLARPDASVAPIELMVPARRITLSTVHVVANASCPPRAESPSVAAQSAWTAIRTALEASALTRDRRLVTTAALRFQQQLRLDGRVDYADTTRGRSGERPFVAPSPAALERDGYFKRHDDGSEEFFAPDETVLLSSGFTKAHCINMLSDARSVSATDTTSPLLALSFTPRDHDTRPEIKGIIWIDSATSELRRIDFEYVRTVLPAPADSLGGSVTFAHLATGAWIISEWRLRIPRWRVVDRRSSYVLLDGYLEVGGRASVVRELATPGPNVPRRIMGSVYDSVAHRPLSGAHVHLADLGREVITDSAGHFQFDSVGPGMHAVWADHAALDSMGLYSLGARVDATPQVTSQVALAVPSFASLWSRACTVAATSSDGFVFGTVHADGADSASFAKNPAAVSIAWRTDSAGGRRAVGEPELHVSTDSLGNYAVCGVTASATLTLSASRAGGAGILPVTFKLGAARMARRDISLRPASALATAISDAALGKDGANAHRLRVVRPDGSPIPYANVSVNGGMPLITDARGDVALGADKMRSITTAVRRIGFQPWFGTVDFPDTLSRVTITLTPVGQRLGEVRITANASPISPFVRGFYDRWAMRQKGLLTATFIGPEELEFRHPDNITNVLRGLLGVRMKPVGGLGDLFQVLFSAETDLNCPMAVVLDGKQIYPTDLVSKTGPPPITVVYINRNIVASQIMGIEVYARGGNMPIELQVNDTRCGVVAFWTGSRK